MDNTSTTDHSKHHYVWPMKIIERTVQPVDSRPWQIEINAPARRGVWARIGFDDITGKTVRHYEGAPS